MQPDFNREIFTGKTAPFSQQYKKRIPKAGMRCYYAVYP